MRLVLLSIPFFFLATPASSADLDRPYYGEREYIERPAPRIVERERVIEHHHHYVPAPVYTERRVYVGPTYYPRRAYFDDFERPDRYAYAGHWRPRHFFPRGHYWHRHHHHRGW